MVSGVGGSLLEALNGALCAVCPGGGPLICHRSPSVPDPQCLIVPACGVLAQPGAALRHLQAPDKRLPQMTHKHQTDSRPVPTKIEVQDVCVYVCVCVRVSISCHMRLRFQEAVFQTPSKHNTSNIIS